MSVKNMWHEYTKDTKSLLCVMGLMYLMTFWWSDDLVKYSIKFLTLLVVLYFALFFACVFIKWLYRRCLKKEMMKHRLTNHLVEDPTIIREFYHWFINIWAFSFLVTENRLLAVTLSLMAAVVVEVIARHYDIHPRRV